MSVQIISECGAKKKRDAQNVTRQPKPVFGKWREQNDDEKRNDKNTQQRQAFGRFTTGFASEVSRELKVKAAVKSSVGCAIK